MTILMCAQKLTDASLIYRTVPKTKTSKMKKTKKTNGYAQKKRCRARNNGVSPCAFVNNSATVAHIFKYRPYNSYRKEASDC